MIRELIVFELRLGSETDRFKARLRDVQASMRRLGVEPGRNWWNVTGQSPLAPPCQSSTRMLAAHSSMARHWVMNSPSPWKAWSSFS